MKYILNKRSAVQVCMDMIKKCWNAKDKQLYVVSIERFSKKRSLQQNAMYWAMLSELAWCSTLR